jgi:hypothetical protein
MCMMTRLQALLCLAGIAWALKPPWRFRALGLFIVTVWGLGFGG